MSEQIRIAYIEQDAGIGGAEVNLFYLFNGMDRERFHPLVIVPYEGPLTERLKEMGVEYRIVPRPKLIPTSTYIFGKKIFNPFAVLYDIFAFSPAIWRIRNCLREERIDVVHTNSMVAHIYGAIASRMAGLPSIWHMQDIVDPEMALGLVRKSLVLLGRLLPDVIVAVSKAVGDMFTGKTASKVRVIYNGTDVLRFSPAKDGTAIRREFNIPDEELVVGMVGRLTQWKGQREFLKAASIVAAHIPNTKFLIVGDTTFGDLGYKDELCRLADQTGLSSKVIFTGFRTDVPELVAAMDLCVLPSVLPDPCPLVLFDYMASAKPVVATKLGGAPEIIEHGKDGLLTDPCRTDDFAGEMIGLLRDASARKRLAYAARQKVVDCFTLENFVARIQKLYLEVVH